MDALELALRKHFGFEQFRPGQRAVIEHVLAGRHTLAVLPTGLGKSLCYQLPAQLLPGLTIVISPLIALMQDQVAALSRRGFGNVTYLSSTLSPAEIGRRCNEIERGLYKLIYVAPERCDSPRFQQLVRQRELSLVVIDEAHCISQWGHDFRPHYRTLLTRLPELRRATFLALTATATPEVQDDIAATLALPALERISADFNRPNLHFDVIRADERAQKDARLLELLRQESGAAIVYASTRKEAALAFELLRAHGLSVCLYHAGLSAAQRTAAQQNFLHDHCRFIVATVAFGLGIDKPHVRRVIHYNLPGSLENYYQEAGRGGRDGELACCTLFYSMPDVRIQRFLLEQANPEPRVLLHIYDLLRDAHPLAVSAGDLAVASKEPELAVNAALQLLYEQQWLHLTNEGKYVVAQPGTRAPQLDAHTLNQRRWRANERLKLMIAYALEAQCRRAAILNYFGQDFAPPCAACDVCAPTRLSEPPPTELIAEPPLDDVNRLILQTVAELDGKFRRSTVAGILTGSHRSSLVAAGLHRYPRHNALPTYTRKQITRRIDALVERGLLALIGQAWPRLLITATGRQALGALVASLAHTNVDAEIAALNNVSSTTALSSPRSDQEEALRERLKQWRRAKAGEMAVPAFIILYDNTLAEIAHYHPRTPTELAQIKGIGLHKLAQFGAEIINLVHECLAGQPSQNAPAAIAPTITAELRLRVEMWRQGGHKPDAKLLLELLRDLPATAPTELIWVIAVLKELDARQAGENLVELFSETKHGNLLMVICDAVGQLGARMAIADLMRLLDDERPGVRRAAARALGRLRASEALPKLARLADNDSAEYVRLSATAAVALIKEEKQR